MKLPLKLNTNNDIYWNTNKFRSYGDTISTLFSIGGRGIGKTTGCFIDIMNTYNRTGGQFVYVRRYKDELATFMEQATLDSIVDGVKYKPFKGYYICSVGDDIIGWLVPLSISKNFKSAAKFGRVQTIFFDEFTVDKTTFSRYLRDEVTTFFNFVSSIARTRTDYKLFFCGNNNDLFNPYYQFFNIPNFENTYIDKARGIFAEYPKNSPKLMELEKKTPLYKLTQGTAFARYHYENKYIESGDMGHVLQKKPNTYATFIKIIIHKMLLEVAFYDDPVDKKFKMHITGRKGKADGDNVYCLDDASGNVNVFYLEYFRKRYKTALYRLYYNDCVTYNSELTMNVFQDLMEMIK